MAPQVFTVCAKNKHVDAQPLLSLVSQHACKRALNMLAHAAAPQEAAMEGHS